MNLTIAGALTLTDLSREEVAQLIAANQLENPTYYQAIKRNPKARYALSPFIPYYRKLSKESFEIGRGKLAKILRHPNLNQITDLRTKVPASRSIKTSIKLRDYQQGDVEAITAWEHGLVKLSTGYGKTIIALEVASRLQQKTLIITDRNDIYEQFITDITTLTNQSPGRIQGKIVDLQDLTVATIQSLTRAIRRGDLHPSDFGLLIVDECHRSITQNFRQAIEYFNAFYRYGFTGTDRRSDGQGPAIGFLYGDKLLDKKLPTATPTVQLLPYDGKIWIEEYADMIEKQVDDADRNRLIAEAITREASLGRKVLVLTKRRAHYQKLAELLPPSLQAHVLSSSTPKEERKLLMQELRRGEASFQVLLGTYSLLSTGVDIPSLDTVVLAGDLKSDVLTEQSVGRILRLLAGKKDPKIVDVQDRGNFILYNQAKERRAFYEQMGWAIENQ